MHWNWMKRIGPHTTRWRGLLVETFAGWWEDRAPRLGAALAYYTVLALAPVLVLVTPVASAVLGNSGEARTRDPPAVRSARRRAGCKGCG